MKPAAKIAKKIAHARNFNAIGPDGKRHLVRIRPFQKAPHAHQQQLRLIRRAGLIPWFTAASRLIERYSTEAISKGEFRKLAEEALVKITPNLRHITHNPQALETYLRNWLNEPIILVDSFRSGHLSLQHLEEQVNRKVHEITKALSAILVATNLPPSKPKQ